MTHVFVEFLFVKRISHFTKNKNFRLVWPRIFLFWRDMAPKEYRYGQSQYYSAGKCYLCIVILMKTRYHLLSARKCWPPYTGDSALSNSRTREESYLFFFFRRTLLLEKVFFSNSISWSSSSLLFSPSLVYLKRSDNCLAIILIILAWPTIVSIESPNAHQ